MKIKIIGLMMLLVFTLQGQTSSTQYEYDSQGNCIKRISIIIMDKRAKKVSELKPETESYSDDKLNLNIYPNPTQDLLTIDISNFDETSSAMKLDLYNLSGKLQKSFTAKESQVKIDLSEYPSGTYILRLHRDNKVSSWKIIKID